MFATYLYCRCSSKLCNLRNVKMIFEVLTYFLKCYKSLHEKTSRYFKLQITPLFVLFSVIFTSISKMDFLGEQCTKKEKKKKKKKQKQEKPHKRQNFTNIKCFKLLRTLKSCMLKVANLGEHCHWKKNVAKVVRNNPWHFFPIFVFLQ